MIRAGLLAGVALVASLTPHRAQAEDLRTALVAAYNTNPTLQSARANQRATDENVPIEKADGRPSANIQGQYTEFLKKSANSFTSPDRVLAATGTLTVPIYQGGGVRNAIKAAKTRVEAGQADLRGTESSVFSEVVGAYMDVILREAV